MASRGISLSDDLYQYLLGVSLRDTPIRARLREETAKLPHAAMQIAPEQGQFMGLLVELTGARCILEVGTFTGYSALCMAEAAGPEGRIVTCDVDAETTAVARRTWAEAGVAERIDLRLAPALETLDALLAAGEAGRFDLAFVDADKRNYDGYVERALELLRPGGLLLIDNVLWDGQVIDPEAEDPDTEAIRALNLKMHHDERVTLSMIPVGDGLTLGRKR
ncbi:MAG: class I SAM-dependent methyltransferase [Kiloniellales bacterium]|nr:class I SAM-dependent methyltransferase [Kiloniellales bacterium]